MVVRRQGRGGRGAVVAHVTAGGVALGLLVSGCAAQERPELRDDLKSLSSQARQADDPGWAREALHRAARVLAEAGGAKVRTSMETVSGGTRLTIHGTGGYDFARPAGELTVLVPADAAGTAEHRAVTEVFTPGELFMKNRGAGVPGDKWVRLSTPAFADGNLLTNGATDPLAAAELLGGAREVTYMRDERVGGVRVKHYWGTIDLGQAARAAPERDRGPLAVAAKGFSSGTVAFDAYLDDQGRLRRLSHRFSVAGGARGRAGAPGGPAVPMTVVSTVDLSDFGTKFDVVLPASADIYAGTVASPRK
ncbi:hypothetical protein QZH56_14465 [Streptomyces olivoreticuli]|uniref:hypothetical protein n=1 Tax=Streptomyces olivoreticuli TaxID=68246 RepID=UPI00265ACCB0|nr:hypothetical protein [Streptomyces olivoreticuli]WKK26687.1 hypothetical protein QZH56_14465 [Streptomyces olivoreticuli]